VILVVPHRARSASARRTSRQTDSFEKSSARRLVSVPQRAMVRGRWPHGAWSDNSAPGLGVEQDACSSHHGSRPVGDLHSKPEKSHSVEEDPGKIASRGRRHDLDRWRRRCMCARGSNLGAAAHWAVDEAGRS